MNPSAILKLMSAKAAFTKNHPKFSAFCKAALSRPIEPGTIIEISLQRPGEEPMMANIKVQQEDLDLLESLKGLRSKAGSRRKRVNRRWKRMGRRLQRSVGTKKTCTKNADVLL